MILNRHVSRLEAFSDAIFAFAATYLVLSLRAEEYADLRRNLSHLPAVALSFAAMTLMWAVHNGFFRRYEIEDATTIVLNAVFLFVVIYFVFPLKFAMTTAMSFFFGSALGLVPPAMTPETLAEMFMLYSAGWIASFLCIAMLYLHAARQRASLGLDDLATFDAVTQARHYGTFVVAGVISFALAAGGVGVDYGVPGFVYFLMGPLGWWNGSRRSKQRERLRLTIAPG